MALSRQLSVLAEDVTAARWPMRRVMQDEKKRIV
jgi:hypothetical protein